jgi:hypothetical protein
MAKNYSVDLMDVHNWFARASRPDLINLILEAPKPAAKYLISYADIDYAAKMTYRYYGQLFTDVVELGDGWSK